MKFKLETSDIGEYWLVDSESEFIIGKISNKEIAEFLIDALNTMHEEEEQSRTIH